MQAINGLRSTLASYKFVVDSLNDRFKKFILDCWLGSDLWSDAEFTSEFFTNAGMSAIFAALGCYGVIRSAHRAAKPKSVTNEQE